MNILITGGTGFIGSALSPRLLADEHRVVVISRRTDIVSGAVTFIQSLEQLNQDEHFDVVINLAGEPIANKRWSERQKQRITASRLETTQQLLDYFQSSKQKPSLFISGSAIGYYGLGTASDSVGEEAPSDESFSSQLCQQWEAIASQASSLGIRTCLLRTGIVLGKGGGALGKMLLPFKLGLGGKMGSGDQWMSWIHLDDLIGIILHCINNDGISGPVNGTAPNPVSNKQFTQALAKALHRPAILPVPSLIIKLLMGQMGEELLLSGKRVLPEKMLKAGYVFKFKDIDEALVAVVK
jgi:uncharacterized protein (TIGR01777 family)